MVYHTEQVYSDKTDFNDHIQFVWELKFSNNQFKFQNSGNNLKRGAETAVNCIQLPPSITDIFWVEQILEI